MACQTTAGPSMITRSQSNKLWSHGHDSSVIYIYKKIHVFIAFVRYPATLLTLFFRCGTLFSSLFKGIFVREKSWVHRFVPVLMNKEKKEQCLSVNIFGFQHSFKKILHSYCSMWDSVFLFALSPKKTNNRYNVFLLFVFIRTASIF